jgi:hypothetical protein
MDNLKDFELARAGNLVTVQWRGSPKLSVGVLSTITESEALERAATLIDDGGSRPGFDAKQLKACTLEIRLHAKRVALVDKVQGKVQGASIVGNDDRPTSSSGPTADAVAVDSAAP